MCRFGSVSVSAIFSSSTSLVCIAPAAIIEGMVQLSVSFDGGKHWCSGQLSFLYWSSAVVLTASSPIVPIGSSFVVVLRGYDFRALQR